MNKNPKSGNPQWSPEQLAKLRAHRDHPVDVIALVLLLATGLYALARCLL